MSAKRGKDPEPEPEARRRHPLASLALALIAAYGLAALTSVQFALTLMGLLAAAGTARIAWCLIQDRGKTWHPHGTAAPAAPPAQPLASPVRPVRPPLHVVARTPGESYEATR